MLDLNEMLAAGVLVRGCEKIEPEDWGISRLMGGLSEMSSVGCGATTVATDLLWEAQRRRESCAWLMQEDANVCMHDVATAGVDLTTLVVLRTTEPLPATEFLLRSGGFGLIIVDFPWRRATTGALMRLVGPAKQHQAAVVFLTRKAAGESSLGSLISLHVQVSRETMDGGFACRVKMQKDKRQGSPWQNVERYDGPSGLC